MTRGPDAGTAPRPRNQLASTLPGKGRRLGIGRGKNIDDGDCSHHNPAETGREHEIPSEPQQSLRKVEASRWADCASEPKLKLRMPELMRSPGAPAIWPFWCADNNLYVGSISELDDRVPHNDGRGCEYTALRRPGAWLYSEQHPTLTDALAP